VYGYCAPWWTRTARVHLYLLGDGRMLSQDERIALDSSGCRRHHTARYRVFLQDTSLSDCAIICSYAGSPRSEILCYHAPDLATLLAVIVHLRASKQF
jgi:hypothetical protein